MDVWRRMYETNVFGLIEVTRRAIPALRAAGGGVVCNVTSSSILAPVPFYGPYRSSKAAVSAIGESLRAELAPFDIRVLEIMPGPIDTDMLQGSDRPPEAIDHEGYRGLAERYYEGRRAIDGQITSTADAARAIADAILDDAAPLRVGCDPLSVGMLEGWRASRDEDFMQAMLPAWVGNACDEAADPAQGPPACRSSAAASAPGPRALPLVERPRQVVLVVLGRRVRGDADELWPSRMVRGAVPG